MLTLIGGLIVAYFVYVLISRKNDKPSTDPPAMAHAALREIIERAAEEARKLPELSASAGTECPREGRPIAEHSYEDLLATAILNKVIERCQREQRVDGNSNVLRDTDSPKAKCTTTEHSLEEEAPSYVSCRLECSGNRGASATGENEDDREPMSFMMEERIEEVTTITSNDELRGDNVLGCTRRVPFPEFGMDIVDPPQDSSPSSSLSSSSSSSESSRNYPHRIRTRRHVADHTIDLVSPIESWEDNWLFQRKRTSGSQPDPVAMLVPSSNADYKALIGDKDAEDTSDLSECSSTRSDDEIEKELLEAINNVVPRSPRTSECNAEIFQEMPSIETQLEKNEIVACHTNTNIERIEIACEKRKKDDKDKPLEVSEEKTVKDEENERKRGKGSSLIATEEKTKEKECGRKAIAIESSVNDAKMDSEKLSERNDRTGNVTDENEEQRESEYTEHYDTAIQRHLDSLTKVDVRAGENETSDETRKIGDTRNGEPENEGNNSTVEQKPERSEASKVQLSRATIGENHTTTENDRLSAPPRPGTIAEREHKKWENAAPIENNPYSEESIRKRCLERQYSRTSDISSAHYELTRLNEVNLDALLVPDRSDIKRFGRDYYINQSKSASGERQERAGSATSSVSSRPNSSLSQRSSSRTGDERQRERQDDPTLKKTDSVSVLREDRNITTASWRKNNTEATISPETNNRPFVVTVDLQKDKNEEKKDETTMWRDHHQRVDDILEDQRKNNKNEINAKLNNREHILEAERKDDKENTRKIRRIDLKAYGFENEFSDPKKKTARQQRVVNRLDLSSYGYENGVLRRARSNIQLNRPLRNEKSNLTKRTIERRGEYKGYVIDAPKSLDCKEFTNSTKDLNKLGNGHVGSRLISAKSMPNVADDVYYETSLVHENRDKLAVKNLIDRAIDRSEDEMMDECNMTDDSSLLNSCDEISSDVDRSFEDIYAKSEDQLQRQASEEFQMLPSVKRLAEVFGRRQKVSEVEIAVPAKVNKISAVKTDDAKERSSTPEVRVVETPRQMHSLTARSLSKEFREGLRQMPGKVTSPPVSRSVIEERSANRAEVVRSKREGNDTIVISPGKLKSNIIFWEQMQKRS